MKLLNKENVKCSVCDSTSLKNLYYGHIREGKFPAQTKNKYQVVQCIKCNFVFLKKPPKICYSGRRYRENYNKSSNIKIYSKLHNLLQKELISKIGKNNFKNKIVLDSGCAGGDFLDLVKKTSKKTIGVEPAKHFHRNLRKKGHMIFNGANEIINKNIKVDIITSFGVVEHTSDPAEYLAKLYKILKKGGKLIIITENINDILLKVGIKKFNSFFYRTAHTSYFDNKSLGMVLKKVGFKKIIQNYWQHHDLSNFFCWIKNNKPTGNQNIMNFKKEINNQWRQFLEKNMLAQMLFFISQK